MVTRMNKTTSAPLRKLVDIVEGLAASLVWGPRYLWQKLEGAGVFDGISNLDGMSGGKAMPARIPAQRREPQNSPQHRHRRTRVPFERDYF